MYIVNIIYIYIHGDTSRIAARSTASGTPDNIRKHGVWLAEAANSGYVQMWWLLVWKS